MTSESETRSGAAAAPGREHPGHAETDFDHEPVPGLPGAPPVGERIVWQGAPSWRVLAWRAFGLRAVLVYFAAVAAWRSAALWAGGAGVEEIAAGMLKLLPFMLALGGILALMAWVSARATVYTLTTRRVAMRIGVVSTITLNLPHRWIANAALAKHRDGSGDIALKLAGNDRLAYLMLWPHVRPWRFRRAEPCLRALPDAGAVAEMLSRTLREAQAERETVESAPAAAEAPAARPAAGLVAAE